MRYTLALFSLLLLPSCGFLETYSPARFGELHTSALGISFYWFAPSGPYHVPEDAGRGIDEAFELWVPLEPGYSREALLVMVKSYEVQLYPGSKVQGDDASMGYAGYAWAHTNLVEVAMDRRWTDIHMNLDHVGMLTLRHEWRHVLRGAWHP